MALTWDARATLEALARALRDERPDGRAIYRFGTFGMASASADSDVDLAFLAASPQDPVATWRLAQRLAALARRDVDLVDPLAASTVMRAQVVSTGEGTSSRTSRRRWRPWSASATWPSTGTSA